MKITIVFSLILILISCSDNDDQTNMVCGVDDPTTELDWLKAEIDERETNPTEDTKYCYISQASYENEAVFIYYDCNPLINKIFLIHDCEGNLLNNTEESQIIFDSLEDSFIIWKPVNFACEVD